MNDEWFFYILISVRDQEVDSLLDPQLYILHVHCKSRHGKIQRMDGDTERKLNPKLCSDYVLI